MKVGNSPPLPVGAVLGALFYRDDMNNSIMNGSPPMPMEVLRDDVSPPLPPHLQRRLLCFESWRWCCCSCVMGERTEPGTVSHLSCCAGLITCGCCCCNQFCSCCCDVEFDQNAYTPLQAFRSGPQRACCPEIVPAIQCRGRYEKKGHKTGAPWPTQFNRLKPYDFHPGPGIGDHIEGASGDYIRSEGLVPGNFRRLKGESVEEYKQRYRVRGDSISSQTCPDLGMIILRTDIRLHTKFSVRVTGRGLISG